MILDTSALVAIFFEEPEFDEFMGIIFRADVCRISAASFVELSMAITRKFESQASEECKRLFSRGRIRVEALTLQRARLANQAFLKFGKGRHPEGLNLGDCFSYALAKATGEPLLFKGEDFRKTDPTPAG